MRTFNLTIPYTDATHTRGIYICMYVYTHIFIFMYIIINPIGLNRPLE